MLPPRTVVPPLKLATAKLAWAVPLRLKLAVTVAAPPFWVRPPEKRGLAVPLIWRFCEALLMTIAAPLVALNVPPVMKKLALDWASPRPIWKLPVARLTVPPDWMKVPVVLVFLASRKLEARFNVELPDTVTVPEAGPTSATLKSPPT